VELIGCNTRISGFSINHRDLCPYLGLARSGVAALQLPVPLDFQLNRSRV
jgi:hypothetical protein